MENVRQDDLIMKITEDNKPQTEEKSESTKPTRKAKKKAPAMGGIKSTDVPKGFIEVKLDSMGRLGYPAKLHFRNYSMSEALELASADESSFLEKLVGCLNDMVYEDFDVSQVHEKDLEEIMMSIYAAYWGKTFEGFSYYVDESIEDEEKKNSRENISVASIPINRIETIPIREDFKEPIRIKIDGDSVCFRLPRINDAIKAKDILSEMFLEEDREMSDLRVRYERAQNGGEEIAAEDVEKYEEYLNDRNKEYFRVYQSLLIVSVDGEEPKTLEQRLFMMDTIGFQFWKAFNKVLSKQVKFGINPEVTFRDTVTGNEITRRFQFRFVDFVPSVDDTDDAEVDVSFGA